MHRLVLRVAVVWVVAAGVVSRPLPVAVSDEGTRHSPCQALVGVLPAAGVLAAVRAGSPASPSQDAQVLAHFDRPALPQPLTVEASAEPGDVAAHLFLHRPHDAQRGPPLPA